MNRTATGRRPQVLSWTGIPGNHANRATVTVTCIVGPYWPCFLLTQLFILCFGLYVTHFAVVALRVGPLCRGLCVVLWLGS